MRFKGRQPFQNSAFLIGYRYIAVLHIFITTYPRSPHRLPTKTVRLSALSDSSNLAHRFRCRNPFSERVGRVEARHPADLVGVEDGTIQTSCHLGVEQQCYSIIYPPREIIQVNSRRFYSHLRSTLLSLSQLGRKTKFSQQEPQVITIKARIQEGFATVCSCNWLSWEGAVYFFSPQLRTRFAGTRLPYPTGGISTT